MNVALLTRYPRVDRVKWKRTLAQSILDGGHSLSVIYTDSSPLDQARAGLREFGPGVLRRYRASKASPSPDGSAPTLGVWAEERGVPVHRHGRINELGLRDTLTAAAVDLLVLAGAAIVPSAVLRIPRLATINAHYGLLPEFRGMNVTEWSIWHGEPVGVSVHIVDPGIDTGDILLTREIAVEPGDSLESLRVKHQALAAHLLGEAVSRLADGSAERTPQRTEDGRQFYRMHPALRARVERRLASGAYLAALARR